DSEKIDTDLPAFIADYVESIARASEGVRTRVELVNKHPGMKLRFNPIDISIVIDNLVSNAKRAKASRITFDLSPADSGGLLMRVTDNGRGFSKNADPTRVFD